MIQISIVERTEWNLIGSNHTSDNEINLFITSMITDRIGGHEVLLPINHKEIPISEKRKIAKL